jgi:hypothetical protein
MNLKAKLLSYTAAIMLTTGAAFAAIDGNALADAYLADGYTFVEVKVGPTQTKVEAIKDGIKVEVIYDNETQDVIKREEEAADAEDAGRTGKEVRVVKRDFEDDGDRKGRKDDDDEDDDDDDDDDGKGRGGDDGDDGNDDNGDDGDDDSGKDGDDD